MPRGVVHEQKSDHVYLYVPPDSDGDLPRPSVSLGHFAVVGHVRVCLTSPLGAFRTSALCSCAACVRRCWHASTWARTWAW